MSSESQAHNELEKHLIAAQEGRIPPDDFIALLMKSEVFMPVYEKHDIGGLQVSEKAKPLTLEAPGGERVLVLFTSPDRARGFVRDYPGYGGGLVAEFSWILEKMGVGFGITLNPGQDLGLELEARMLKQLAH